MSSWIQSPFKIIKELPDGFYTTSKAMLKLGMCVCDKCGKTTSIDYKFCKVCNQEILIVVTKKK